MVKLVRGCPVGLPYRGDRRQAAERLLERRGLVGRLCNSSARRSVPAVHTPLVQEHHDRTPSIDKTA